MRENNFSIKLKSARFNVYNQDSGNSYTVTKHDDWWVCDCKSYLFCIEPKTCKHIEQCKEDMEYLIAQYDEEEED